MILLRMRFRHSFKKALTDLRWTFARMKISIQRISIKRSMSSNSMRLKTRFPSPRCHADRKMKELLPIVALGAFAGRVDQSFSLLHQLFKCIPRQLYLLSPRNVSFLLPPGRNHILASAEIFGPCCGVIPVSGPATITLEGFRWNLGSIPVCRSNG